MDVITFFGRLEDSASREIKIAENTKEKMPGWDVECLQMVRYHSKILLSEARMPVNSRNRFNVLNSWKILKKYGHELKIFDDFRGDEKLRSNLLCFLNGEKPIPPKNE